MKSEGISLGWNCSGAQLGLNLGLRNIKQNGYKTCPFDMMVSNYVGLCKCVEDDFKYFCDPEHLELRKAPIMTPHIPNQKDDEMWICNTYYGFAFNHESPYHGNLYLNEKWSGPNHFIDNNFEHFISRYERRINNFRTYLEDSDFINFVMWRYNSIPTKLVDIIREKHQHLNFKINNIYNFGPHTVNCLHEKTENGGKEYEMEYLKYMGVNKSEHPEEYSRYSNGLIDERECTNDYVNLINPLTNDLLK